MNSPSNNSDSRSSDRDQFKTTHWSVVLTAGQSSSPAAAEALEQLCRTYWHPLYFYVRRWGKSVEDAQDLTQEFFARFLKGTYLQRVNPKKGRFRAYLLAAMKHFLSDMRDQEHAIKRGGGNIPISLDAQQAEERYRLEPADTLAPDKLYELRWALTVLENARNRLAKEYALKNQSEVYEHLKILEPDATDGPTYQLIAARLGMTETAIKTIARRIKQRCNELVREEISHTVASVAEIDEEIHHLVEVIRSGGRA